MNEDTITKSKKYKYLLIYNYEEFVVFDAKNVKDCILQFAEYTGSNSDLFNKAMNGVEEVKDCIDMYNHFSMYRINHIYQIEKEIYSDK